MGRNFRREFLIATGSLLAAGFARAQQHGQVRRVGWLTIDGPASVREQFFRKWVLEALQGLGYRDGENLAFVNRYAEGEPRRMPALARDLVALNVDLIVTMGDDATFAARDATRTIPIVMAGSTYVLAKKLVASYARPGGNITGLDWWPGRELQAKYFQILKFALPSAQRAAWLVEPAVKRVLSPFEEFVRDLGSKTGLLLAAVETKGSGDLRPALNKIEESRSEVLYVSGTDVTRPLYGAIAAFAAKHKIISMAGSGYVDQGGLLQHSADPQAMATRLASYIDRILRGAKPSDLPVEQPTKYELVLNRKTARAMGLTLPPSFLAQVDRVVE